MRLLDRARTARRHLDARFTEMSSDALERPSRGWIRAIREALGMSAGQLGRRLGISQPSVFGLEESEEYGSIKLSTLSRVAAALNCRLVYALVPNEPLEAMVEARARGIAAQQLEMIERTMALENQTVEGSDLKSRQMDFLLAEIDPRTLWDGQ